MTRDQMVVHLAVLGWEAETSSTKSWYAVNNGRVEFMVFQYGKGDGADDSDEHGPSPYHRGSHTGNDFDDIPLPDLAELYRRVQTYIERTP